MLQKWEQSTLLNSVIISDYSPNTSKTSTKLVCNQQVTFRSNNYQEGRWQTPPSAEREPELALCHRHSRMTCTQQKSLPDPAVPQPLSFCRQSSACVSHPYDLTKRKKNVSVWKHFTMHKIIWKNMLKNCHCILFLFLYFPLSIIIRPPLGTGYFVRRTFDVPHYVFPPHFISYGIHMPQ